jgi:hypothetical protein
MDRHYANVDQASFDADLAEKQWVIEIIDRRSGRMCGFSTQMLVNAVVADRPVVALFSGDTIIDRRHWGDQALSRVWGRFALSLVDQYPHSELYWFLISQGYKTYRFLPLFFHEFYPRVDAPTPQWVQQVIDGLGCKKCPDAYDERAGVVRAHARQYRLREGVADITPHRQHNPHIRFFAERNPRHFLGDELCCIAPLTRENFTAAAFRVMGLRPTVTVF